MKTKGQRRAEDRRRARHQMNRATDPSIVSRRVYGGEIRVSVFRSLWDRHQPDGSFC